MRDRDLKAGLRGHTQTGTPQLSRRAALGGAAALAAIDATFSSAPIAAAEPKRAVQGKTVLVASQNNAVVTTSSGSVRGYTRNGIHTFKGIPYSQPTSGANRFMPPAKPTPWTGVRSSMH